MESFLLQATYYLAAAVLLVPITVRFGFGSVLGYLAAGLLLGPVLGLAGQESHDLQHFAEFGIVVMLFLIGLELRPHTLWEMRHRLIGLGGMQVVLTSGLIAALLLAMGEPWRVALTLGLLLSLSSTAIVVQTLSEKGLMRCPGGRSAFAVLLAQDIAVVPMLALIPLMAGLHARQQAPEGAAKPLLTLVQSLPGWEVTLLTLGIVLIIVLVGHFLTGPVFRFVHAARLPEMGSFISLLILIGIAFLMMLVGLSPALGSFIAGVVLANSEFRHQIEADLKPFKGILLGLFFMTVGISIDTGGLLAQPLRILMLTLALIAAKMAVLYPLISLFRLRGRDRTLFSLALAQGGEFGFLIVSFALAQDILPAEEAQRVLLVISLSMLLTPLLFALYDRLAHHRGARPGEALPDTVEETGPVLIVGIGRFGQVVNRMARAAGIPTVVLDADASVIERMRRFGVKGYFGDPSRPELLLAAGLAEAQILVVAVDDPAKALRIVTAARQTRSDLHIVARARDRVHVYELYRAGANDIVRETFDSSIRAGRYVLENMGLTEYEAARLSQSYFNLDRAAMRDLAALWEPGQPVHLNDAYVSRARQLDEELRTALLDDQDDQMT
ncbi:MAG: cation:proton antiporter, partial [Gemmobacter sp.]|nr:cation:proton antiporter [Gemmobacter sp.]